MSGVSIILALAVVAQGADEADAMRKRIAQDHVKVRFLQHEVWPAYRGPKTDTVDIEIFQHWLEPDQ